MPNRLICSVLALVAAVTAVSAQDRPPGPLSSAEERALKPGDRFSECGYCPELVVVPAGQLRVGWPPVKEEAPFFRIDADDVPPEPINVPGPFAIGRYEVSAAEWGECVREGACNPLPGEFIMPNVPAAGMTYAQAEAFVAWINAKTGKPYLLPDLASWEFAAKGGTETYFWWGNDPGKARAHCFGCDSPYPTFGPAPVGRFPPNPFGLYDTVGNVSEWLSDCARGESDSCRARLVAGGDFERSTVHASVTFGTLLAVKEQVPWNGLRVMRRLGAK